MFRTNKGFTIVELVVIIAVIGVLAAMTSIFYTWVATISRDQARETDAKAWVGTFNTYKSQFFVYPVMPASAASPAVGCLGKFPDSLNRCGTYNTGGAYYSDSTSNTLLTEVAKIGDTPENNSPIIDGKFAGPMYRVTRSSNTPPYTVTANFLSYSEGDCPQDFTDVTSTSPYSTLMPSPDGKHLCRISTSFTYNPN